MKNLKPIIEKNKPAIYNELTYEANDIIVSINQLKITDCFLEVESCITCKEPLNKILENSPTYILTKNMNNQTLQDNLFFIIPLCSFKINDKNIGYLDMTARHETLKNDYSFISYQKYKLPNSLPKSFKLTINFDNVCCSNGPWTVFAK